MVLGVLGVVLGILGVVLGVLGVVLEVLGSWEPKSGVTRVVSPNQG